MPAKKSPPRLYVLCLDALVPILNQASKIIPWDDPKVAGPLDDVPGDVASDLMDRALLLKMGRRVDKWHKEWDIYLTPNIRRTMVYMDSQLLSFVQRRCKNVRKLCIAGNFAGDFDFARDILPLLYRVEILHMKEIVGRRRGCFLEHNGMDEGMEFSNDSLLRVCADQQERLGMQSTIEGLSEVYLPSSSLTVEDVKTILKQFPRLQVLRHDKLVIALYELHIDQWRKKPEAVQKYSLRNIDFAKWNHNSCPECEDISPGIDYQEASELALSLCPEAVSVRLHVEDYMPVKEYLSLVNVQKLMQLDVVSLILPYENLNLSHLFAKGVSSYLYAHRQALTRLTLESVNGVDIEFVIAWCPHLQTLDIRDCTYVRTGVDDIPLKLKVLSNLQHVSIVSRFGLISPSHWEYLLASTKLTHVTAKPANFTSSVLDRVLNESCWSELHILDLAFCDAISEVHVLSLLTADNSISKIILRGCDNIGRNQADRLLEYIRSENLDVLLSIF